MKYKLLPTWLHVDLLSRKIEQLFRKIQIAGSPPAGVEGKRIVRAYRSEIDKKSKHEIAKWRKKVERKYAPLKENFLEDSAKKARAAADAKIENLQTYYDDIMRPGHGRHRGLNVKLQQETRRKLDNLKKNKKRFILHEVETASMLFDQKHKRIIDHEVDLLKRRLAPKGFNWRLKFAIDTYGGRAYAGSMVLSLDPKGKGEWRKMGSITAPTKK